MIEYKVSSFCSYGNCVEVGVTADGHVAVRDGKNPDGGHLLFDREEWTAFVAGVRNAEFDLG